MLAANRKVANAQVETIKTYTYTILFDDFCGVEPLESNDHIRNEIIELRMVCKVGLVVV